MLPYLPSGPQNDARLQPTPLEVALLIRFQVRIKMLDIKPMPREDALLICLQVRGKILDCEPIPRQDALTIRLQARIKLLDILAVGDPTVLDTCDLPSPRAT